jgi:hypothetical protein
MMFILSFSPFLSGVLNNEYREKISSHGEILDSFSWGFHDGTIDGLVWRGNFPGTYEVVSDPSGLQAYVCKIITPSNKSVASVIKAQFAESFEVRIKTKVLFVTPYMYWLRVSNEQLYKSTHLVEILTRSSGQWVVRYRSQGIAFKEYTNFLPQANTTYNVELYIKLGYGNGEISLKVDDKVIASIINVVNMDAVSTINFIEIGDIWGYQHQMYIYRIDISARRASYNSIDGIVVDINGNPVEEATIRAGISYLTTSAKDGSFELVVPATNITLEVFKSGYNIAIFDIDASKKTIEDITITLMPLTVVPGFHWEIRAFNVMPHWTTYGSTNFINLLDEIKVKYGSSVNAIEIRMYFKPDPYDPNNITFSNHDGRATIDGLRKAVEQAHKRGFKVLLGIKQQWGTGKVEPTNLTLWIENYGKFVVWSAQHAEQWGVDVLLAFWEMRQSFLTGFENLYSSIIDEIRLVFTGLLSNKGNWWWKEEQFQAELGNTWYSKLDFLTFAAFMPLSDTFVPRLEQMVLAWRSHPRTGFDFIAHVKQMSETFNKTVLLNIGYYSSDGTSTAPWKRTTIPDEVEQALCWQAFFEGWKNEPYILGVHMEHYDKPYVSGDTTASFRDKFAEDFIKVGLESVNLSTDLP